MGHAAYSRGSAAIRASIDREQAAKPRQDSKPLNWESDRARLIAEADSLRADLAKARRALASSRAALSVERCLRKEETERLRAEVREWALAAIRNKRSHEKASAMIRALLTPEQVEEYRKERGM